MNWAGRRPISSATRSAAGWRSSWNAADGPVPSPASPPRADGPAGRRPSSRWSPSSSRGCRSGCSLASWDPARCACPITRQLSTLPISGTPEGVSEEQLAAIVDDVAHCPAYFQLLAKAVLQPGLLELAQTAVPAHLVLCGKDRVFPAPRSHRYFQAQLPASTRITTIDGVGHIPMFEAPARVTEVIDAFISQHSSQSQAVEDPPAS